MAKRFIDTNLFRKPFTRGLQGAYKLLYIYIFCECNNAGIWEVELDVASLRLDAKLDEAKALEAFGDEVIIVAPGRWFLPDFIKFQYKVNSPDDLNPNNKAHKSVIDILKTYKIKDLSKGLNSPLEGSKDKDKDKDEVKVLVKEEDIIEAFLNNFSPYTKGQKEDFLKSWSGWLEMRKKKRNAPTERAKELALNELLKLSFSIDEATKIVDQSIFRGWAGFFSLKSEGPTVSKTNESISQINRLTAGN